MRVEAVHVSSGEYNPVGSGQGIRQYLVGDPTSSGPQEFISSMLFHF